MLFSLPLFIFLASLFSTSNAAKAFVGNNLYYAAGLSSDEQTSLFTALQSAGAKVLRVWVDGQSLPQKGTTITSYPSLENPVGTFNDKVLNLLDDVMYNASKYGIKVLISCYSSNSLDAGDAYSSAYGSPSAFYTNSDAISKFKERLWHIMYHVNPHNGKQWKDSSEYIFAFEAMNEAFAFDGTGDFANEHASWQCTVAESMRSALNGSTDIALLTGGGQWVSESVQSAYLSCDALDIIGIHAYAPGDLTTSNLTPYVTRAKSAGKKLLMEEWGACYFDTSNNDCPKGDMLATSTRDSNIKNWGDAILAAGIPFLYWQIIPNADPHDSYDYEIGITGDPNWSTLKAVMTNADTYSSPFDFSAWLPS